MASADNEKAGQGEWPASAEQTGRADQQSQPQYIPDDQEPQDAGQGFSELEAMYGASIASPTDAGRRQLADLLTGNAESQIFKTARQILSTEYAPVEFVVAGLLPPGFSILAGRPKVGKSWLALQIAVAVATGGRVFGEPVQRRKVLYLALEDSERRIKARLAAQQCTLTDDLVIATRWPSLIKGGLAYLTSEIENAGHQFIVIDTLSRLAQAKRQDDEIQVALALGELQRFCQDRNVCSLAVDHHRKPAANMADVIDDITGLTLKSGVIDAALGLYRQRGQQNAELKVTGRDIDDIEWAVSFDKATYSWQKLGAADEVRSSQVQSEILETIRVTFAGEATCSDVARSLRKDRGNLHREFSELVATGALIRKPEKKGREVLYKLT